jgi:tetratricopeptide (TPR) repeat protein
MNHTQKIIIALALVSPATAGLAEDSSKPTQSTNVHHDTYDLTNVSARLRDINLTLRALPRTATEAGLGAQTIEAKNALDRAEASFKYKNWNGTINEGALFLNLTQRPDPATSMRVHYILGRAYEERRQYLKASRAYSRYLAIFTTNQELSSPELTDVFERLIKISTKNALLKSPELSRFLSTVVAIQYPEHLKDELKYLSAVAGAGIGKKGPAVHWLGQLDTATTPPEMRARAKYFKALLAINEKNWQQASKELNDITRLAEISSNLRDNANLSLARVLIELKKPKMALASYSQIPDSSPAYHDASYEKALLLVNEEKYQEANELAQKWLAKYPNDPDVLKIKTIITWLSLKAGNFDRAQTGIDETSSTLASIQKSLKSDFQKSDLTLADGERLRSLTSGHSTPSAELEKIIVLFNQLKELNQRLFEIDGIERSLIYSLANGQLANYKPAVINQITQYESLTDDVLKLGLQLVHMERDRLGGKISQLHEQKLTSNAIKRTNIFSHHEELRRQARRWESWFISADQASRLAGEWSRISRLDAKNSASRLQAEQTEEIEGINKTISTARAEMLGTLRSIKENQVGNLAKQSAISDLMSIIDDFSKLVYQDHLVLSSYQPDAGTAIERLDHDDAGNAWKIWLDTANLLYVNLQKTEKRVSAELSKLIADLERVDATKSELLADVARLTANLEKIGGEKLPIILSEFDYSISRRAGKQLKWAGDLEFLRYIEASNEHELTKRKHALELQILSDDDQNLGPRRNQ